MASRNNIIVPAGTDEGHLDFEMDIAQNLMELNPTVEESKVCVHSIQSSSQDIHHRDIVLVYTGEPEHHQNKLVFHRH